MISKMDGLLSGCKESNTTELEIHSWVDDGSSQETKEMGMGSIARQSLLWLDDSDCLASCEALAGGGCTRKTSKQEVGEQFHEHL